MDGSQKKLSKHTEIKEIKYSLKDLIEEADQERAASSMARQIIDQLEIQKLLKDQKKKNRGHAQS